MKAGFSLIIPVWVIFLPLFLPLAAYSQQEQGEEKAKTKVIMITKVPEYPGGADAMQKFLSGNMKYPVEARRMKITGKVMVTVTVEENGLITKPLVTEGIGGGCDEEALRLVKLMPKWNPAVAEEKAVSTEVRIPVYFMLYPLVQKKPKRASDTD